VVLRHSYGTGCLCELRQHVGPFTSVGACALPLATVSRSDSLSTLGPHSLSLRDLTCLARVLWPVGRALSSRPALGQGPRYGLRLRASGTGGAVAAAPRARRGSRSAVNCTLDSRRDRHFQPQWPPGPAFLETTTAFGGWWAAAHQPPKAGQALAGDNSPSLSPCPGPPVRAHSRHVEKANSYQSI